MSKAIWNINARHVRIVNNSLGIQHQQQRHHRVHHRRVPTTRPPAAVSGDVVKLSKEIAEMLKDGGFVLSVKRGKTVMCNLETGECKEFLLKEEEPVMDE